MLLLSRRKGERIKVFGPDGKEVLCEIEVDQFIGNRVRLAITADPKIRILRGELCDGRTPLAEPGKAA